MPHAIATRMSHISYHADRHKQFFVEDLRLALTLKMCSDQSHAFKEVSNCQGFTVGRKKITPFFSERAASRCSLRHVCTKFRANIRRTDCIGPKSFLTPEFEHALKPSNYDAKPWFLHFIAQNSKCPRRFGEINPEILHTFLCVPAEPITNEWGVLFLAFFFSQEMWDPF